MKVTKHGKSYAKTPPIQVTCVCGCQMEVEELELDGNSHKWVWCPECREMVEVPEEAIIVARNSVNH